MSGDLFLSSHLLDAILLGRKPSLRANKIHSGDLFLPMCVARYTLCRAPDPGYPS